MKDETKKGLTVMESYYKIEDFLNSGGTNKPIEIQSAMIWGGLLVAYNHGDIDWDSVRNIYGEFMSKKMHLR